MNKPPALLPVGNSGVLAGPGAAILSRDSHT